MGVMFQANGIRTVSYVLPKPYLRVITQHWRNFVDEIRPYPGDFEGRGIVICAGGKSYFTCCWVLLNVLRKELKCRLPIEVWYRGNEITPILGRALQSLGVVARNIEDYYPIPSHMSGYVMKPMAILFSRFKEVLFLDADNVCTSNPDFLFDLPEYRRCGAIFWPDFWTTDKENQIWEIIGVRANEQKEQESGQILINKECCWRELNLALYFNMNSHIYYKYLIGDKDTFRFAWMALNKEFYWVKHEVSSCGYFDENSMFIGHTMVQCAPDGHILFLHRNLLKWDVTNDRMPTWDKIKSFDTDAVEKRFLLFWDAKRKMNIMDLDGDVVLSDFRKHLGDLEDKCLLYLHKLRNESFYIKSF